MRERHCADARYVWNLAVEQFRYRERKERGTTGRSAPGPAARQKQLAQARQEFEWLRGGQVGYGSDRPQLQRALAGELSRAATGGTGCRQGRAVDRYRPWRGDHHRQLGQADVACAEDAQA
jgi:hypothetical protein